VRHSAGQPKSRETGIGNRRKGSVNLPNPRLFGDHRFVRHTDSNILSFFGAIVGWAIKTAAESRRQIPAHGFLSIGYSRLVQSAPPDVRRRRRKSFGKFIIIERSRRLYRSACPSREQLTGGWAARINIRRFGNRVNNNNGRAITRR